MTERRIEGRELVGLLRSGEACAIRDVALRLGLSESAVLEQVGMLKELGLEIEVVGASGGAWLKARCLELLDPDVIERELQDAPIATLEVCWSVDSTNARLLRGPPPPAGKASVCVAEFQTVGRGRRGRCWLAPLGSGLCLSLGWRFQKSPPQFSALGLAVGVGVARALVGLGVPGLSLKWPNDVLVGGAKLGGILIEMQAEAGGLAHVVTGIGLNVSLPGGMSDEVRAMGGLTPVDLATVLTGAVPGRNRLTATLVRELVQVMNAYAREGLGSFRRDWLALDYFAGRHVRIDTGGGRCVGVARGIDEEGALLIDTAGGPRRFVTGEASLRLA